MGLEFDSTGYGIEGSTSSRLKIIYIIFSIEQTKSSMKFAYIVLLTQKNFIYVIYVILKYQLTKLKEK